MLRCALFLLSTLLSLSAMALEPFAVVKVPVANLREEPRHGAELMSQGIMGTPLKVKSRSGEWLAVTMPDGYEGYMIDNSVTLMDTTTYSKWASALRGKVDLLFTELLASADVDADVVSPLYLADIVEVIDTVSSGEWLHASLADGREGYVRSNAVTQLTPFGSASSEIFEERLAEQVIARGKRLLGREYLWGGTSVKANDCSGFTRILFQSVGTYLPRDAWQQAMTGEKVTESQLLPGDLVFFSNARGRVNHVGIYIGDGKMLHCSGQVRIDRLYDHGAQEDKIPLYHKRPSSFRRVLTGKPLESDKQANLLYFNK